MRSKILMCLAIVATSWTSVSAEEMVLRLDPETTRVEFELGATLHTVHGTARLVEGEVRFDPSGGPASGRIVVDATSADTDHEGRDEDMHAKVLESERYGAITFRPTGLSGPVALDGESTVQIEGMFSIHGSEHPLTADARVVATGDPESPSVELTATFEVPYVAWGMKNPSKLLLKVSKTVGVELSTSGTFVPVAQDTEGS